VIKGSSALRADAHSIRESSEVDLLIVSDAEGQNETIRKVNLYWGKITLIFLTIGATCTGVGFKEDNRVLYTIGIGGFSFSLFTSCIWAAIYNVTKYSR